eukprot:67795_1
MKNNIDQYIIPSSIINLFFQYYFDIFEAKWSNKYKGNGMILSENDTKVTSTTDHKGCRGRDPITRGMIVEWTANCFVINGICLGVISSNTTDFNCCAAGNLQDVYGIDDCPSMYYYGNNKRHVAIESDSDNDSDNDNNDNNDSSAENPYINIIWRKYEQNAWNKPRIPHQDSSQWIRIVCDYKTFNYATLTYYFDDKIVKSKKKDYTFKLPIQKEGECWYIAVDFWRERSWCKIK